MSKKQKKKHKLKAKMAQQDDDEDDDEEEDENENTVLEAVETNENASNAKEAQTKPLQINNEATAKPSICSICKEEFDSRNKLFEHIKEKGHAIVKPVTNTEAKSKTKKSKVKSKK